MAADPGQRWHELVTGPHTGVALDEALLLVAAHAHPQLDVESQLDRLDELAARCRPPTLDGLLRLLFVEEGFTGNRADYYDPRNSYLDDVLERRTGLPITLSILTLEVGRRCGVPLAPVNLPGHFLLRDRVDPEVFVDPFNGGAVLDRRAVERLHAAMRPGEPFGEEHLRTPGPLDILARVLANLQLVFTQRSDLEGLTWVLRLRTELPGVLPGERGQLARILAARGLYREASDVASAAADNAARVGEDDLAGSLRSDARRFLAKLN
jgi:regulator of sirC expression with transglutaminase-like and TPR domain